MPTASSAILLGVFESFEPVTSNLFTRRVGQGEFLVINKHLVRDLDEIGLWTNDVKNKIVNNINMKNISECISNTVAEQTQNYKKLRFKCKMPGYCNTGCPPGYTCDMSKCDSKFELRNISQNLIQQATGTCTAKSENLNKIINEASSEIKQTSEATTKGIDPTMMSLMSALPSIITACIFLSILYFLMQGGDQKILNIAQGVKGL